jgi:hypothetical protein
MCLGYFITFLALSILLVKNIGKAFVKFENCSKSRNKFFEIYGATGDILFLHRHCIEIRHSVVTEYVSKRNNIEVHQWQTSYASFIRSILS